MNARKPKVLLAMSGGVDSSVAAALLLRDGYDVVGVFMRLGTPGESLEDLTPAPVPAFVTSTAHGGNERRTSTVTPSSQSKPKTFPLKIHHQGCCSISDAADARLVAAELGIPLYVCNFKKDFSRIIEYFATEYAAGRTPNPCVRCNDWLKFGKLHDYAMQLGAQFVASGHYARVVNDATPPPPSLRDVRPRRIAPSLLQAIDHTKDQSYVLFGAPRERLNDMLLPVGGYHKSQIRSLAQKFGLPVFDKPDSQEICFVPDNDYASLVERMNEDAARAHEHGGDVLDADGAVVGTHAGQHRYTIGQRRGVGVAAGRPIYVIDKDPIANTITVGDREDLLVSSCTATEVNLLVNEDRFAGFKPCLAKYRYNADPVPARARLVTSSSNRVGAPRGERSQTESKATLEVRFDAPQPAVAPGQAVVLYGSPDAGDDPDLVLGGGWIESARREVLSGGGDKPGRGAQPGFQRGPADPNTM